MAKVSSGNCREPPWSSTEPESLAYTNCSFSLECRENLKAFRKTKVCYKAEASAFPFKASISNSDTNKKNGAATSRGVERHTGHTKTHVCSSAMEFCARISKAETVCVVIARNISVSHP